MRPTATSHLARKIRQQRFNNLLTSRPRNFQTDPVNLPGSDWPVYHRDRAGRQPDRAQGLSITFPPAAVTIIAAPDRDKRLSAAPAVENESTVSGMATGLNRPDRNRLILRSAHTQALSVVTTSRPFPRD